MEVLGISEPQFYTFLLILLRVGALFTFAPIFSSAVIPQTVKAALVLGLSLSLAVLGIGREVPVPAGASLTAIHVAQEILLGMLFGFVANLVFVGAQLGGQIIGVDMGLGIVSVLDPESETQVSIVSQVQFILAILLFLAIGGDRLLIEVFAGNLERIPPGTTILTGPALEALVDLTAEIFRVALQVAAPAIVALFAANVILGIFARSVPQMNMLILGFPLKILIGLLVLGLSLPHLARVILGGFAKTFEALRGFTSLLG